MSAQMPDPASRDLSDEVPEADALDQRTLADPQDDDPNDPAPTPTSGEADPTDVWEQAQTITGEEDDHDRDDA